jgi:hypothetical protein
MNKFSTKFRYILRFGIAISLSFDTAAAPVSNTNPKIAPDAVTPYTKKAYPTFYSAWGAAGMKKVNDLMPLAAAKAAASPECNKVELVELSQQRSTPGKNIIFFVDCANRKRFYIDQSQLASAAVAKSQTNKMAALSDSQAKEMCDRAIKVKLNNPLTYDRQYTTTSVYRAPTNGNVVVEFKFEAKNDLGAPLPHKARCTFTDRGLEDAIISKT